LLPFDLELGQSAVAEGRSRHVSGKGYQILNQRSITSPGRTLRHLAKIFCSMERMVSSLLWLTWIVSWFETTTHRMNHIVLLP
jgi:hypothetical protein